MELISKARKELGSAGFYHSILVRRLWNTVWKTVVKMSGNPELPMEDIELPEPHEEVIEVELHHCGGWGRIKAC
jgi:hypothetical protein